MARSKTVIYQKIEEVKERLSAYRKREAEMLAGGVQSYTIGSRSLTRYNTDLAQIRSAIKELEEELAGLEAEAAGGSRRKAVGVVPRDW